MSYQLQRAKCRVADFGRTQLRLGILTEAPGGVAETSSVATADRGSPPVHARGWEAKLCSVSARKEAGKRGTSRPSKDIQPASAGAATFRPNGWAANGLQKVAIEKWAAVRGQVQSSRSRKQTTKVTRIAGYGKMRRVVMRKSLFIGTALAFVMGTAGAYAASGNSLYIDQTGIDGQRRSTNRGITIRLVSTP